MKKVLTKTVVGLACTALLATSAYAAVKKISAAQGAIKATKQMPDLIRAVASSNLTLVSLKLNMDGGSIGGFSLNFKQKVNAKALLTPKFNKGLIAVINARGSNTCKFLAASGRSAAAVACVSNIKGKLTAYTLNVNGKAIVIAKANNNDKSDLLQADKNKKIVSSIQDNRKKM
jgi:hypothetical protein